MVIQKLENGGGGRVGATGGTGTAIRRARGGGNGTSDYAGPVPSSPATAVPAGESTEASTEEMEMDNVGPLSGSGGDSNEDMDGYGDDEEKDRKIDEGNEERDGEEFFRKRMNPINIVFTNSVQSPPSRTGNIPDSDITTTRQSLTSSDNPQPTPILVTPPLSSGSTSELGSGLNVASSELNSRSNSNVTSSSVLTSSLGLNERTDSGDRSGRESSETSSGGKDGFGSLTRSYPTTITKERVGRINQNEVEWINDNAIANLSPDDEGNGEREKVERWKNEKMKSAGGGYYPETVEEFLKGVELTQYLNVMLENGFDRMRSLEDVAEADMEVMQVKRGHRRIIQRELASLKGVQPQVPLSSYRQDINGQSTSGGQGGSGPGPPQMPPGEDGDRSTSLEGEPPLQQSSRYISPEQERHIHGSHPGSPRHSTHEVRGHPWGQVTSSSESSHAGAFASISASAIASRRAATRDERSAALPLPHHHHYPSPDTTVKGAGSPPSSSFGGRYDSMPKRMMASDGYSNYHSHLPRHEQFPPAFPQYPTQGDKRYMNGHDVEKIHGFQHPRSYHETPPVLASRHSYPGNHDPPQPVVQINRNTFHLKGSDVGQDEGGGRRAGESSMVGVGAGKGYRQEYHHPHHNHNYGYGSNHHEKTQGSGDDVGTSSNFSSAKEESSGNGKSGKRKYTRHPKPDSNAPERPPSAYVAFSNELREDLKDNNVSFSDMAKITANRWKNLPPEEKDAREAEAAKHKEDYQARMAEYKKTRNYQDYQVYLKSFYERHSKPKQGSGSSKKNSIKSTPFPASTPSTSLSSPAFPPSSSFFTSTPASHHRHPVPPGPSSVLIQDTQHATPAPSTSTSHRRTRPASWEEDDFPTVVAHVRAEARGEFASGGASATASPSCEYDAEATRPGRRMKMANSPPLPVDGGKTLNRENPVELTRENLHIGFREGVSNSASSFPLPAPGSYRHQQPPPPPPPSAPFPFPLTSRPSGISPPPTDSRENTARSVRSPIPGKDNVIPATTRTGVPLPPPLPVHPRASASVTFNSPSMAGNTNSNAPQTAAETEAWPSAHVRQTSAAEMDWRKQDGSSISHYSTSHSPSLVTTTVNTSSNGGPDEGETGSGGRMERVRRNPLRGCNSSGFDSLRALAAVSATASAAQGPSYPTGVVCGIEAKAEISTPAANEDLDNSVLEDGDTPPSESRSRHSSSPRLGSRPGAFYPATDSATGMNAGVSRAARPLSSTSTMATKQHHLAFANPLQTPSSSHRSTLRSGSTA